MCGIAGVWGQASETRLRAMADRLRHRGPDDEGFWVDPREPLGLAHRRLSIIDLQTGQQPVFNEKRTIATVFNGEIYNYRELREQLISRGHRFATESDTEVIVHLYEDMGPDFVGELRGMFAIAVWDADEKQLVLVRDRVGKKPLYFSEVDGEFLFASEIKGLVAGMRRPPDLDEQALADYLSWGEVYPPQTIYRQVRSAEPSELLIVRDRRVTNVRKYWQLRMLPKVKLTAAEAVDQIDQSLREAVRLRLRSDVPVGAFLSGGIDSGIVVAMAAQQYPGRLQTVTIGFDNGPFDERSLARLVAQRYDTDHHEVLIEPDVVNDLPKIACAYDQPFSDHSAVPSYYVARAARQFVKVVLNGDGGDELFAGYRRYIAARINGWLSWADGPLFRPAWRLVSNMLPSPRGFRTAYAFAHRFVRGMAVSGAQRYLAWSADMLSEVEKRRLCDASDGNCDRTARNWLAATEPAMRLVEPYLEQARAHDPVDRMLAADFQTILPHDLLVKMDIACMAHGLEARSPLLDHVLIDTVSHYPSRLKLPGCKTKPLLRLLSRRYLPEPVQSAPKRGFEMPIAAWLRGELRSMCEDTLLSRNGLLADLFSRSALEQLVRREQGLDPNRWARRTWAMLMLGLWDAHVRRAHQWWAE